MKMEPPRIGLQVVVGLTILMLSFASMTAQQWSRRHSLGDYLDRFELNYGLDFQCFDIDARSPAQQQSNTGITSSQLLIQPALGIAWNVPLYFAGEDLAVAVSPALQLSLGRRMEDPDTFEGYCINGEDSFGFGTLGLPILLTLRHGAEAEYKRRSSIGAAAGFGLQTIWQIGTSSFVLAPAIAAEFAFGKRGAVKLRLLRSFAAALNPVTDVSATTLTLSIH